jgi:hypothetical protein
MVNPGQPGVMGSELGARNTGFRIRDWMAYYERFWDEHLERLEKHLTKRDE